MTRLRVSRQTIMKLLASGELKGFQRGRVIRIDRDSVEALLRGQDE